MAAITLATVFGVFFVVTFVAWKRYLWVAERAPIEQGQLGDEGQLGDVHQNICLITVELFYM
jgi:hypothetical protein